MVGFDEVDRIYLTQGTVHRRQWCEHDNLLSSFIKGGKSDYLRDC